MPRPRSLTHAELASAALTVLDRDGLAALSMRAVAKELDMSTMALYRYVNDREELEGLLVELVLSSVDAEPPAADVPWQKRIEIMVGRLRDSVGAHPSAIPLTLTHRHRSPAVLAWSETVLGILAAAGIAGERRVLTLRALLSYVNGALQLEHLGSLAGPGTVAISQLPPAQFPYMSQAGRLARNIDADQEFLAGLTMLLRGMEPPDGTPGNESP